MAARGCIAAHASTINAGAGVHARHADGGGVMPKAGRFMVRDAVATPRIPITIVTR